MQELKLLLLVSILMLFALRLPFSFLLAQFRLPQWCLFICLPFFTVLSVFVLNDLKNLETMNFKALLRVFFCSFIICLTIVPIFSVFISPHISDFISSLVHLFVGPSMVLVITDLAYHIFANHEHILGITASQDYPENNGELVLYSGRGGRSASPGEGSSNANYRYRSPVRPRANPTMAGSSSSGSGLPSQAGPAALGPQGGNPHNELTRERTRSDCSVGGCYNTEEDGDGYMKKCHPGFIQICIIRQQEISKAVQEASFKVNANIANRTGLTFMDFTQHQLDSGLKHLNDQVSWDYVVIKPAGNPTEINGIPLTIPAKIEAPGMVLYKHGGKYHTLTNKKIVEAVINPF